MSPADRDPGPESEDTQTSVPPRAGGPGLGSLSLEATCLTGLAPPTGAPGAEQGHPASRTLSHLTAPRGRHQGHSPTLLLRHPGRTATPLPWG